jgi:hypothetical protein
MDYFKLIDDRIGELRNEISRLEGVKDTLRTMVEPPKKSDHKPVHKAPKPKPALVVLRQESKLCVKCNIRTQRECFDTCLKCGTSQVD